MSVVSVFKSVQLGKAQVHFLPTKISAGENMSHCFFHALAHYPRLPGNELAGYYVALGLDPCSVTPFASLSPQWQTGEGEAPAEPRIWANREVGR